jgi:transposase-like protein
MRNIVEKVRKRDYDAVKAGAHAIYRTSNLRQARQAFRRFRACWRGVYASMVKQLEKDLPELLTFFDFPQHLWRKLRTTNVIERCFVEVRRRNRPMVYFVNVASVDRIIYAIFNGLNKNPEWENSTLRLFTLVA